MPELTVSRHNTTAALMVCMYCGSPATATTEWREVNRKPEKATTGGGGTNLTPTPTGDDPISAVIAILMLPLALWELLKGLVAAVGAVGRYLTRPGADPVPPRPPGKLPTTLVIVTTCERHRRFRDQFVWAGLGMTLVLVALWGWAVVETRRVMGTENVGLAASLLIGAIFATVLFPLVLGVWYAFAGPVIVDRTTEDSIVLDRVRQAYFDATGLKPTDGA